MLDKMIRYIETDLYKKIDDVIKLFGEGLMKKYKNNNKNIYALEGETCKIISAQLYYNKHLYPYGVPWRNDFNDTTSLNNQKHLQYFVPRVENSGHGDHDGFPSFPVERQLNCIMGPLFIHARGNGAYKETLRFKVGKTGKYKIRILYYENDRHGGPKQYHLSGGNLKPGYRSDINLLRKYPAPVVTGYDEFEVTVPYNPNWGSNNPIEKYFFEIVELSGAIEFEGGKEYTIITELMSKPFNLVGIELINH
jgi:hypothetical protein